MSMLLTKKKNHIPVKKFLQKIQKNWLKIQEILWWNAEEKAKCYKKKFKY